MSRASILSFATLCAIIGVAAALRLWGWDYGLPHPTARPDEEIVLEAVFQMFALERLVPITFAYPSFAIYFHVSVLELYYGLGQALGDYDRAMDMLLDIVVRRPGLHYRIARLASVGFGVATVAVTYSLAKRAYDSKRAGLLAAAALSTCLLHVIYSRFATVDAMVTFFTTLTLLVAVKAARDRKWSSFLIAGALVGLSASVKYNGVLVCAALAVPALVGVVSLSGRERWSLVGKLSAAGVVSGVAFFATSPFAVLRFDEVRRAMAHLSDILHTATGEPAMWVHLRDTFPLGLGWPFYLAAIAGLGRALWSRRPEELALLGFVIPFYVSMAGIRLTYPRYVMPLVPVLAVFAAGSIRSLLSQLDARARVVPSLIALALLAAPGLHASIGFDRLAAQRDTRLLATDWIGEHLPRRAAIAVCRGYGAPDINDDRRRPPAFEPVTIACTTDAMRDAGAGFVVTHEYPPLGQRLAPDVAAWLEDRASVMETFDPLVADETREPYYFRNDVFYLPFAGFRTVERGGPVVTIWQLDDDPSATPGEAP